MPFLTRPHQATQGTRCATHKDMCVSLDDRDARPTGLRGMAHRERGGCVARHPSYPMYRGDASYHGPPPSARAPVCGIGCDCAGPRRGKNEQVVVFGTAHSGTLVLKALRNVGVQRIVAVYRGASPFRFARDGDTEGIKQESAAIADEILAGGWADVLTLVPTSDVGGVQRALLGADAVVYSIGFRPSLSFPVLDEGGGRIEPAAIGACRVPGLFGFGIGFPSFYTAPNGTQYPDVGFAGFIDAIIASPLV